MNIKQHIGFYTDSVLHSYAQIFFSKNRWLAVLVILASFVNWDLGLWGLAAALTTNLLADWLGFDKHTIREGLYGLNSLLVAMGLALAFEVNGQFVLVFFSACLLTLFLSVALLGYLSQLGVPFLSLPFLLAYWIIMLAVRQYDALALDVSSIYAMNDLYRFGGMTLVNLYEYIHSIELPLILDAYFNSLAAILFHGNIVTGMLIAVGILISSRIAFSLSLVGYITGYLFYYFVGADMTQLYYSYIGFNFILSAMAIGGFFFIPTWKTYSLLVILTPVIAMLIAAFSAIFMPYQLPVLSLPFAIIVIMVIYVMNFSTQHKFLKVTKQQYSPEKNLYAYDNYIKRFSNTTYYQIGLPFFGEWTVSQGHEGKHTHKGDWNAAWDFVITDDQDKTYRDGGALVEHFYCYGLPVSAPASGYVVAIVDDVPDNAIGDVDIQNNWGNSIVIKHTEHLYTKISHLKAGSFKVAVGDYVQKGKVVAYLGNSGRSPEPHIHFQVQANPYVGSKTMKYPLAYYMLKDDKGGYEFKTFEYPKEGETIFGIKTTGLMREAFKFIPGQSLTFEVEEDGQRELVEWEVHTNGLNQPYLYCRKTGSYAYYVNDGTLHYFTTFEGDRNSLLYYFYLATYKVLLGYYKQIDIQDKVPLQLADSGIGRYLQDFIAPFMIYRELAYQLNYKHIDNSMRPKEIILETHLDKKSFGRLQDRLTFDLELRENQIDVFRIKLKNKTIVARQLVTSFEEVLEVV
ncbi:MAG: peptidoglycan DD-metalloendopeptidase family protein [Aureispira sp.]|nr:peptidoglycan DD-metalloendopeptidase family protein [Aureispira sp.]